MKKKRSTQIQKQYPYEEASNAYLIEVSLNDYDDIYDQWDPAPFKKRFIDDEFNEFILTSAEDIPAKYNLIIVLYIPESKKDTNKEKAVVSAYGNYYLYAAERQRQVWLKLRKKTLFYFLFSMTLLGLGSFNLFDAEILLLKVIKEGIFIGGWVFLWEVITNIFKTRRKSLSTIHMFQRLNLSKIRFSYLDEMK